MSTCILTDRNAKILDQVLVSLQSNILLDNKTIPIVRYNMEDETYYPTNIKNADALSQEELALKAYGV